MTRYAAQMAFVICSIHNKRQYQSYLLIARLPIVSATGSMRSMQLSAVQCWLRDSLSVLDAGQQVVVFSQQGIDQADVLAADSADHFIFADKLLQSFVPATSRWNKAIIDRFELCVGLERLEHREVQRLLEWSLSSPGQLSAVLGRAGLRPHRAPAKESTQARCLFEVRDAADTCNDGRSGQRSHAGQGKQDLTLATLGNQLRDPGFQSISMLLKHAQLVNELLLFCDQTHNAAWILCANCCLCQCLELRQISAAGSCPGSACTEVLNVGLGDLHWYRESGTQIQCGGAIGVSDHHGKLREQLITDCSQTILALGSIVDQLVSASDQAAQSCRCFGEWNSWANSLAFVEDLDIEFDLRIQGICQAQSVALIRFFFAHTLCSIDLIHFDVSRLKILQQGQVIVASAFHEDSALIEGRIALHGFYQFIKAGSRILEAVGWAAIKSLIAKQFAANEASNVTGLGYIDSNKNTLRGRQCKDLPGVVCHFRRLLWWIWGGRAATAPTNAQPQILGLAPRHPSEITGRRYQLEVEGYTPGIPQDSTVTRELPFVYSATCYYKLK